MSLQYDLWNHDLPIQASFLYLKIRVGVIFYVAEKRKEKKTLFLFDLSHFFESPSKVYHLFKTYKSFIRTLNPNPKIQTMLLYLNRYAK